MTLIHEIAKAISDEARALYNEGLVGLDLWTPNININRDPRWGRNQEVPGEDPYLTAQYVASFMRGLQEGDDPNYVKMVGTCKHYAAYSLDNWDGITRHAFNAVVNDYDMVDTYLPAFKACVQDGKARSIMCSYNALNGVPTCADPWLLQTVLKDSFGFNGYIVGDCGAIDDIIYPHNYTKTPADTCAVALKAGTDLDCGQYYQNHMGEALKEGKVTVGDLRRALYKTYKQLFELGVFDPDFLQAYSRIPPSVVDSPKHSALALEAAKQSIVLLKNDKNLLPLSPSHRQVAVIGPNADVRGTLLSNYHGERCHDGSYDCITSPLDAVMSRMPYTMVTYTKGCDIDSTDTSGFKEAMKQAQQADVVIAFMGIDNTVEAEERDRETTTLPGVQENLLKMVYSVQKNLVVVLLNGGSLSIEWTKDHVPAIIEAWYGGMNGAAAIADVIVGNYNPGGKMPVTVYPADYVLQVPLTNMNMTPSATCPGRTYRYYTGKPLWEFGFGLSYTTFVTSWVKSPPANVSTTTAVVSFRVNVKNTGKVAGDEVVMAFAVRSNSSATGARKQLFGFQRIHLQPGETQEVFFASSPDTLAVPHPENARLDRLIVPGNYTVEVGVGEAKLVAPLQVVGSPMSMRL